MRQPLTIHRHVRSGHQAVRAGHSLRHQLPDHKHYGGTLYFNDGVTQITNGQFITVAQGAAASSSRHDEFLTSGSFTVVNRQWYCGGLGGSTATPQLREPLAASTARDEFQYDHQHPDTSGLVLTLTPGHTLRDQLPDSSITGVSCT